MELFWIKKSEMMLALRENFLPAGSIGKCKFSEKFEELLFWR